jgi:hypothetical protein
VRGRRGNAVLLLRERLFLDEGEEVGVELVLGGVGEAVRAAGVDFESGAGDEFRRTESSGADGDDLIVISVDDERGDVEFLEVCGEVGFGEGFDAIVGALVAAHHALPPEGIDHALGGFGAGAVEAEEGSTGEVLVKLGTVGERGGADAVENFQGQAAGIGFGLEHERRDGADEDGFGDAGGAVAADVAGDFAAAGGVADHGGAVEIEGNEELGEIVGVGVHFVALPRLAGTAVAAAIVGDAAVAVRGEEEHLRFPGIAREGPAVAEDDGLAGAPVFVIDLRAVFGGDHAHGWKGLWF